MFSLPVTAAKLAELSGLSESWIRRGVTSGHLKTACDQQGLRNVSEQTKKCPWPKPGGGITLSN